MLIKHLVRFMMRHVGMKKKIISLLINIYPLFFVLFYFLKAIKERGKRGGYLCIGFYNPS
jgi:hypothetical protein